MAGEAHAVLDVIRPAISLLGLGIGAAIAAKAVRLNPIVGYIVIGAALSAAGLADAFDGPVVAAMAEAGVMFMLFNLGLHFSLGRIREEAGNIFGFGALQMGIAGGAFALIGLALGLPPAGAIIGGFALGLSSTAVVVGLVRERDQQDCPVGRAAQSILIFQDIAAIMLLVAAGALAAGGALGPALGVAALKAVAAFAIALLFARFLTEPLFRLIASARSAEVFTATALFIALAAGWLTGVAGLSLTLGAFLGGVALAESRYRLLVQTEIEAFRGLFLGFFFMTVGLALDPAVLVSSWLAILIATALLISFKCGLNVLAGLANRWSVPGSVQLGFLLGQGSEFALVLFSLPALAGLIGGELIATLVAAIALSLALTPPVTEFGRRFAGRLRSGPADARLAGDDAPIVIIGMNGAGRAVADALGEADIAYLAIDDDPQRFERARADGYEVHQLGRADPRSWQVLGLQARRAVVVTDADPALVREIRPLVDAQLPDIRRIVAVREADHAELIAAPRMVAVHLPDPDRARLLVEAVFEELGMAPPEPRERLVA